MVSNLGDFAPFRFPFGFDCVVNRKLHWIRHTQVLNGNKQGIVLTSIAIVSLFHLSHTTLQANRSL